MSSIYGIKQPDGTFVRLTTFQAMKENIIASLKPMSRLVDRLMVNQIPISQAMLADMKYQLDSIENFIDKLVETEPQPRLQGRQHVVKTITGEVLGPAEKTPPMKLLK